MNQSISQADGRRKNRLHRGRLCCTVCDDSLPTEKSDWGLVWDSGIHGVCIQCLRNIREKIGFAQREDS